VYAERNKVKAPSGATGSGCWTPYGWYVFCDSLANVYRVQPGSSEPEIVVTTALDSISEKYGSDDDVPVALVCPSKQGFVLYAVNQSCQLTVIELDYYYNYNFFFIKNIICLGVEGMINI